MFFVDAVLLDDRITCEGAESLAEALKDNATVTDMNMSGVVPFLYSQVGATTRVACFIHLVGTAFSAYCLHAVN